MTRSRSEETIKEGGGALTTVYYKSKVKNRQLNIKLCETLSACILFYVCLFVFFLKLIHLLCLIPL